MYASVIKQEQSKLDKKSNKRKKANQPDSDSEDEMSLVDITQKAFEIFTTQIKNNNDAV